MASVRPVTLNDGHWQECRSVCKIERVLATATTSRRQPGEIMGEQVQERSRWVAFFWICFAYAASIAVAAVVLDHTRGQHPLIAAALADAAATGVIFAFSFVFRNSSFYDAYWSVAPPLLLAWWAWIASGPFTPGQFAVAVAVVFWGVRLTYNWARGWTGLDHEDWRYVDLQDKTGRAYWLVSFLGIHFFPTVQTFLGSVPLYYLVAEHPALNPVLVWTGAAIALFGAAYEMVADKQLRVYTLTRKKPGETFSEGLWKYSRHPNYFGEITFWWGLFVAGMGAGAPLWTVAGAASITIMFVFVSLPMIDNRMLASRPGYDERVRNVSAVFPLPPRTDHGAN